MERMRFFNTEGPVRSDDHYCVPPLERIKLDIVLGLVRDKKCFVLHAPRQTGKTSALLALRDLLNGGGDYRCVVRSRPITEDDLLAAQERLILRRDTHIDQLAYKLREERVRRVIEPILAGADEQSWSEEDLLYLRDLGLIAQDRGSPPRIANPIYAEVVPRHLNAAVQAGLPHERAWYVDSDGALDVEGLIADFQTFFREHSEHWVQRFEQYREAGPQLLLQAHLQRVVNGGGVIEREYALGRGRTDLLIRWPQDGRTRKFVIECKVRRGELERTIAEGVAQTRAYMDRCGAEAGHLIVFDRAPERTWAEKIFRRDPAADRAPVTVWGM